MKVMLVAGTVSAAVLAMQADAFAQRGGSQAPVYRYCLQESGGGFRGGGQLLCRFDTLEQCWASKVSPADFCYLNPEYFRPRR